MAESKSRCGTSLGKALDAPVYQLLGGKAHDDLRCYTSIANANKPQAQRLVDEGYSALKVAHVGEMLQERHISIPDLISQERAKVEAMREVLGDSVDLILDPGMPFNRKPWLADTALRVVRALDEYQLLWMEQPVLQTNVDDYVRIRELCETPLAAGENETLLHGYKPFFEKRAIDIVQPDATWCGGIGEDMKIMAAADAHDMRIVTHSFSSAVGLAANYHVGFANRNCFMVRYPEKGQPVRQGPDRPSLRLRGRLHQAHGCAGAGHRHSRRTDRGVSLRPQQRHFARPVAVPTSDRSEVEPLEPGHRVVVSGHPEFSEGLLK